MSFTCYCRIPTANKNKKRHLGGGCPQLLTDLISELQGAIEIHIAAYLFNNPIYYEALEKMANDGCKIHITSLPLSGYDDKKIAIEGYGEKV